MISSGLAAAFVSSARFVSPPSSLSNASHLQKWLFRIVSQSKAGGGKSHQGPDHCHSTAGSMASLDFDG